MGIPILILGESGSGKTTSLRNFEPGAVGVISVINKPLPFKSSLKTYPLNKNAKLKNTSRYTLLRAILKAAKTKTMVIDDSQYLICYDSFDRAKIKGYDKFTDMAINFKELIDFVIDELPDDMTVYFLHHIETSDDGKKKIKTIGKMLDQQLTVEGLFTIVLLCEVNKSEHYFITQSDGSTTCKSPVGMFEEKIDNDLKLVDATIREYYGL